MLRTRCARFFSSSSIPDDLFKALNHAPTDRLYVRSVPFAATVFDLKSLFEPFGITAIDIATNRVGCSRGYAFIKFKSIQSAATALHAARENPFRCLDRPLIVSPCLPSEKFDRPATPTDTLYLSRFNDRFPDPATIIADILPQTLQDNILSTRYETPKSSRPRAFVRFSSSEDAELAKDLFDRRAEESPEDAFYVAYSTPYDPNYTAKRTLHLSAFNHTFPNAESVVNIIFPQSIKDTIHSCTPNKMRGSPSFALIMFKTSKDRDQAIETMHKYFLGNPDDLIAFRSGDLSANAET